MGMEAVLILLLLGLRQLESATAPFCYHDSKCAPPSWPDHYPTCNGSQQSPIDIKTHMAVRNNDLGAFTFQMYDNRQFLMKIKHTAGTVKINLNSSMQLRGGGLKTDYVATQFHFHWGNSPSSAGSEHTINGNRAGMELHIVHRQKGISLTDVFSKPEGLAVLGFRIVIEYGRSEDPAWKNLTKIIKYLKDEGNYQKLDETVSLMDLIKSVNLTKYYRYNGSLTTPECNEVVLWTVFEEPIRLNASLVETFFEDLYVNRTSGIKLHNNFRPTQQNMNKVYASRGASKALDTNHPGTTRPGNIGWGNSSSGTTRPATTTPYNTGSGNTRGRPLLLSLLFAVHDPHNLVDFYQVAPQPPLLQ